MIKFGLFYIGLKDETYYWELVVSNLRKTSVVLISLLVRNSYMQLMLILSVLYINHQLIRKFEPYEEESINDLDILSSTAAISTIMLGLLFLDDSKAKESVEFEIVFYCLLFVNLNFAVQWTVSLIKYQMEKIKTKLLDKSMKEKKGKSLTFQAFARQRKFEKS